MAFLERKNATVDFWRSASGRIFSRIFAEKYSSNISIDNNFSENTFLQQEFLDGIEAQKNLARIRQVEQAISSLAIANASVSVQPNGYVLVQVRCSRRNLYVLQSALSVVESKIMILWSDSNG